MRTRREHDAAAVGAKQAPKRKRASKALTTPAAATGWPALFERAAQSPNFDVDQLAKLYALKAQADADTERRAFDQDFAALQAEISRVAANAYDPQKHRSYADINALVDAVGPLAAARGFTITYDTEPSTVPGAVKTMMKVSRNGAENKTSVDVPMDGAGMRGNANMSAPQAYVSTVTHGRKLALTLMFNLTVAGGGQQRPAEPRPERQHDNPPPWDASPRSDVDHLTVLKRAAQRSDSPPTDKQIDYLATLMRERGERPEAVLDDQGRLSGRDAWQAISDRKAVRP